jgi:hypothetical protein
LLSLLLLLSGLATPEAAEVRIESIPDDLAVWAGERYLGQTPLTVDLPEGRTILRLAESAGSLYQSPSVDTLLSIVGEEDLHLVFRVGRPVTVRSIPFGLPLLRRDERIGKTPVRFRLYPGESGSLRLLTPEGPIRVPADTLFAEGHWTYRGDFLRPPTATAGERPLWRKVGRYLLPGLAVALGAGGLLAEENADRAYERYLRSIDPDAIETHYDTARSRDAWAGALWIGAEVSLATAILAWILPERGSRTPEEVDP